VNLATRTFAVLREEIVTQRIAADLGSLGIAKEFRRGKDRARAAKIKGCRRKNERMMSLREHVLKRQPVPGWCQNLAASKLARPFHWGYQARAEAVKNAKEVGKLRGLSLHFIDDSF